MKVDPEYCDDNIGSLDEKAQRILDDWIKKFSEKYTIMGKVTSIYFSL